MQWNCIKIKNFNADHKQQQENFCWKYKLQLRLNFIQICANTKKSNAKNCRIFNGGPGRHDL